MIGLEVTDLVENTHQRLRDSNVQSVEDLQRLSYNVMAYSEDMHRRNREMKDFLYNRLYRQYRVERMAAKAERIITELFDAYRAKPEILPSHVYEQIENFGVERTICDYIAGMTDRFAIEEHQKLFDPLVKT
jgi:dGTPase